jgi:hypothetical protein
MTAELVAHFEQIIVDEKWLPIPGTDWYQISNHRRVRTLEHEVIKSDGHAHWVRARIRRICVTANGQRHVLCATGRRRHYRFVDVDKLHAELFGDDQEAVAA